MTLKKLERAIRLVKAQVSFLATQQKDRKNINRNIIAYSKIVTKKTFRDNFVPLSSTNDSAKKPGSGLTFQVYSHLKNKSSYA